MKWRNEHGQLVEGDCPWCAKVSSSILSQLLVEHLCDTHFKEYAHNAREAYSIINYQSKGEFQKRIDRLWPPV